MRDLSTASRAPVPAELSLAATKDLAHWDDAAAAYAAVEAAQQAGRHDIGGWLQLPLTAL